jgi:hypothetical protein
MKRELSMTESSMRRKYCVLFALLALLIVSIVLPLGIVLSSPILTAKVSLSYPWVYQGESVAVTVVFSNGGDSIASNIKAQLVDLPTGIVADTAEKVYGNLPVGQTGKVVFSLFVSPSVSPNTYSVQAQVSADNASPTRSSQYLVVYQLPVSISRFDASIGSVVLDQPQKFNVTAKIDNIGKDPIYNLSLKVVPDPNAFLLFQKPRVVPEIGPGGSTGNLVFDLQTQSISQVGPRNITLNIKYADPTGRTHSYAKATSVFFKHWYDPDKFGCLIATATYGSEISPEVEFLREFRDHNVLLSYSGSRFMLVFNAWYYSFSPAVARFIAYHEPVRTAMKGALYPLILILQLGAWSINVLPISHEAGVILGGLLISSLIGLVYLAIPLTMAQWSVLSIRRVARKLEKLTVVTVVAALLALVVGEVSHFDVLTMFASSAAVLSTLVCCGVVASRLMLHLGEDS